MNKQELFDKVAVHLIKQGKKSAKGLFCQYRGPNGTRCAIGCLIPDSVYTKKVEGAAVLDVIACQSDVYDLDAHDADVNKLSRFMAKLLPTRPVRRLADALQAMHDCCKANTWADDLRDTARDFRLNTKKLEAAIARKAKA